MQKAERDEVGRRQERSGRNLGFEAREDLDLGFRAAAPGQVQ